MKKELTVDKKYDSGLGFKFNTHFLLICLCGQLCWNVENQFFGAFAYTFAKNVDYVTAMTILSATLTCISTFLFGAVSDRKGNRKKLMGWGYILWGISTIAVGLVEYIDHSTISGINLCLTLIVLLDGVMSFIGSIAYDATFNAWTNDHTTTKNKGFIGFWYGSMPVIATIAGTLAGAALIEVGGYILLFFIISALVFVVGILTLIFVKDYSELKPNKQGTLLEQATSSFRLKGLKKLPNFKEMILACLVICVFFISFNFYFVHLMNWAQYYLGFGEKHIFNFSVIEGVAMVGGILLAIPAAKLMDKDKIPLVCFIGTILAFIGLILCGTIITPENVDPINVFSLTNIPMILAVFFFGTGEILLTEACMMWVRGLFPGENNGQFEGIRCIFFVWLPMLLGTIAGQFIIKYFSIQIDGVTEDIPNKYLFLLSSIVCILTLVPLYFANKEYKKRIKAKNEALAKGIVVRTLFDAIPDEVK